MLTLSTVQLSYLDELLAGYEGMRITGEEWVCVCEDLIANCRAFSSKDPHAVFMVWLSHQVKH